jgi:hypothetical protein
MRGTHFIFSRTQKNKKETTKEQNEQQHHAQRTMRRRHPVYSGRLCTRHSQVLAMLAAPAFPDNMRSSS